MKLLNDLTFLLEIYSTFQQKTVYITQKTMSPYLSYGFHFIVQVPNESRRYPVKSLPNERLIVTDSEVQR